MKKPEAAMGGYEDHRLAKALAPQSKKGYAMSMTIDRITELQWWIDVLTARVHRDHADWLVDEIDELRHRQRELLASDDGNFML
jgi:hypothetical protein